MFTQTFGSTTIGVNGILIHVEIDMANGLPGFEIVGLPDAAVKESRERVRAAVKNSGFMLPARKTIVNLAPADLRKDSSGLDLPIAVALLAASGYIRVDDCAGAMFAAELSLEGKLRGIGGILPMAVNCLQAGIKTMFVAPDNAAEALLVDGLTVCAPQDLAELAAILRGEKALAAAVAPETVAAPVISAEDFSEVQGQFAAKRALEIAAAGGHNVLMVGPPGSGKTMLARRVRTILPALTNREALEVTKIYSIAGMLAKNAGLVTERPFRAPHHTISSAGMIGGGRIPRPGEVTLSHRGVLFLDELPEFGKTTLEVLRQPLEDGELTISRANASISYPSEFMLVASMNPCPCGYAGDTSHTCGCTDSEVKRYTKKISGPLLDRIDIHITVPRIEYGDMVAQTPSEGSAAIRARVEAARAAQYERLHKYGIFCNAQMGRRHLKKTCPLADDAQKILEMVFSRLHLSARSYDRIVKVARTAADLEGAAEIAARHVAEAVQLRGSVQL